jgi:hypothetical protein
MEQWNTAPLSPDARAKIFTEAMKLFGRGRRITPPKAEPSSKSSS